MGDATRNSANNHHVSVEIALDQIGKHLDYFGELSKSKKHCVLGNCAIVDLISLLKQKLPKGARELAKEKL